MKWYVRYPAILFLIMIGSVFAEAVCLVPKHTVGFFFGDFISFISYFIAGIISVYEKT